MGKAYNDFSSLKGLRKELEKQDMNKPETAPEPAARPKAEIPPAPEKVQVELDSTFAATCTYGPAPSEFYGTGATVVTIR